MINSGPQKRIDVLIIEDEVDICFLLSGMLSKLSLKTSYVTTIASAKKFLENQYPDIIFLDNHLPDGFGVEFISSIRKNHPLTKIVMVTAYDTGDDKAKAFKEGADYFIAKPFTRATIVNTVNNLLETIEN